MILPLLARFWPYIAIALLGLGLYASARHNGVLAARVSQITQVANDNAAAATHAQAEAVRLQTIADNATTAKAALRTQSDTRRKVITHAPPTDDGPLANVLRDELRSLHNDSDQAPATPPAPSVGKPS